MTTRITATMTSEAFFALLFCANPCTFAASCGTVANPMACMLTVGGKTTFTVTNFQLVNSVAMGGGNQYQGDDISIDLATGGGLTGLLTFTKNSTGPTAGTVFLTNPNQSSTYTFSYDLAITPAMPGTVAFTDLIATMNETHTNNALATVQTQIPSNPACLVFTGSTFANCSMTNQPNSVSVGEIVSLTGNTGNTGLSQFTALFDTSFTAVPEPSGVALVALAMVCLGIRRTRYSR